MYSGKRQAMHSFLMKQCNDFDAKEHMTLYCFALYMKDTGVTKTSSELEPLELVHRKGARQLFVCDEQAV